MILIDVDLSEVPTTKSMVFAVKDSATQTVLVTQTVATPTLSNNVAKVALAQPAGLTGSVLAQVTALADSGVVGQGTSDAAPVTAGKNVGPLVVKVKRMVAGPDAGEPDGGVADVVEREAAVQPDLQPVKLDTGSVPSGLDAADLGKNDAQTEPLDGHDVSPVADAPADAPSGPDGTPQPDAAVDSLRPDAAIDVGSDTVSGPDSPTNILETINSCKKYVHYPNPPATCASGSNLEGVSVNTTVFTPDGKYLVTTANNSWAKLWKVVDTGLEDTNVTFVGDNFNVTAAISPAGDILALGNQSGNTGLFDLTLAITQGQVSQIGTLSASKLSDSPYGMSTRPYFTTDGKQVVMVYPTEGTSSKGMVAVWDLTTRTVLREFDHDYPTEIFNVAEAPSTGPIWVVLGKADSVSTDGGSHYETTVTLLDASGTTTVKPTFVLPGELYKARISADGLTLATGTNEGEVSLWDLSNKGSIQRNGSPYVEAGTQNDSVYGLGYSRDGQFLAVGSWIFYGPSSLRIVNLKTRAVTQRQMDFEPLSFGFAPNGTTWAYGLGGCGAVYFCK
jgi:WD40 repeat protein